MVRRRGLNVFSLSFLDVMACGLGAVVLLFMIINHAAELRSSQRIEALLGEADGLEQAVRESQRQVTEIEKALQAADEELAAVRERSETLTRERDQSRQHVERLDKQTIARQRRVQDLKADLQSVDEELKRLQSNRAAQQKQGDATRRFIGQGNRQYLTGLKMGGQRILMLIDASASMLDETIVNIIRRRNLPDEQKRKAPKWRRAVATADWLTTQIPSSSRFQIYTFNVKAEPLLEGSDGRWLEARGAKRLDQALDALRQVVPAQGTSLHQAFAVISRLSPPPDNIYLITDGLPTQGQTPSSARRVSARQRLSHFNDALKRIPGTIPINVILLPIEGDPRAVSAYWVLAQRTGGSLLSPARDWP